MTQLSDLFLVRPNLGKPHLLVPNGLKDFQISIAGKSDDVPLPGVVDSLLRSHPPALVRIGSTSGGTPPAIELNIIKVHQAYHTYGKFDTQWTEGVLPITNEDHQYAAGFRWEYRVSVGLDEARITQTKGAAGWPAMLGLRFGNQTNAHALFVHEQLPVADSFTVIQITDPHVSRRNDRIPEILGETRNRYETLELLSRYRNFNDNLRAVIKYANEKVARGEMVFLIVTGDLIDYYHDGFYAWSHGKARASTSNVMKFVEIVTGADGKCEALKCPIFTVLGNHDYLLHEPPLCFDLDLMNVFKVRDRDSNEAFGLTHEEGREYDYWLVGCPAFPAGFGPPELGPGSTEINRRKYIKGGGGWDIDLNEDQAYWLAKPRVDHLVTYLEHINYDVDYRVAVGPHQFVCLNTGQDRTPTKEQALNHELFGSAPNYVHDFVDDGSHNRGISADHLTLLGDALSSTTYTGLVFCFAHAPMVGLHKNVTDGMEILFEDRHASYANPPNDVTVWLGSHLSQQWRIPLATTHMSCMAKSAEEALRRCSICRKAAADFFKSRGYPQGGRPYFMVGARDDILNFGCADGEAARFLQLAAPLLSNLLPVSGASRRRLAAHLSGHTHKIHEFRVEGPKTPLEMGAFRSYLFLNNYSGSQDKESTSHSLIRAADKKQWLQQHAPLLLISGGLKKRVPEFREVIVIRDRIESLKMQRLPIFNQESLWGVEFFCAATRTELLGETDPCAYVRRAQFEGARLVEMVQLMRDLRGRLAALTFDPAMRPALAEEYVKITLWLNSFGVDYGYAARNSMDPAGHRTWALGAAIEAILGETTDRIDKLFAFIHPKSGGNHYLAAWFTHESLHLAKLGGYAVPARNSLEPATHMQWALSVPFTTVIADLKEKYRLQFDRLATERDHSQVYHFCAESLARMATWGVGTTVSVAPSIDPANYLSIFVSLDPEGVWKLLEDRLMRMASTFVVVGSGY